MELAILQIEDRGERLSISAVALAVGVVPGLIHNTYPEIARQIRAKTGRTPEQLLDAKAAELKTVIATLKTVEADRDAAVADVQQLASINETLRQEVAILKALASGKVQRLTPPRAAGKGPEDC